jgi:DNA-binding transcriptional MerR regulator
MEWSIGELAARTGITVRTLHHYDEIGLARPSRRTPAGHRRYTADDVRRLHRIVALRGFGFPLLEIAALLDDPGLDAGELVRRQLAQAGDRLDRAQRLHDQLTKVLELFGAAGEPSAAALLTLIEEMTAVEHAYTPEEFERMAAHRQAMTEQLTPEQFAAMSARRREAWAAMTPEQQEQLIRSRPPIPQ